MFTTCLLVTRGRRRKQKGGLQHSEGFTQNVKGVKIRDIRVENYKIPNKNVKNLRTSQGLPTPTTKKKKPQKPLYI